MGAGPSDPSVRPIRPVPDPTCTRCSKPVTPGTGAQLGDRPIHTRCLARGTQLAAMELQGRARQERERTAALIARAAEEVARALARPWLCPVCDRPLKEGRGGLLYQSDVLVHALCWRAPSPGSEPPAA